MHQYPANRYVLSKRYYYYYYYYWESGLLTAAVGHNGRGFMQFSLQIFVYRGICGQSFRTQRRAFASTANTHTHTHTHTHTLTVTRQDTIRYTVTNHADASRRARVISGVCLSVCLSVFLHDISKNAAAKITKLDVEMYRVMRLFWDQNVKGQGHEKTVPKWVLALLWALVSSC